MNKKNQSRGKAKAEGVILPFDLRTVPPRGRVDVLAANAIERLACGVPELQPLLSQHREAIHASINSQLGPHALGVDIPALMKAVEPFMPFALLLAQKVFETYKQGRVEQQPNGEGPKAA